MKTPAQGAGGHRAADKYFAYAAELLKVNPPHLTDGAPISRLKPIGIEAGKSFDLAKADPVVREAVTKDRPRASG